MNQFKPSKAALAVALGLLLVACESEAERKAKADAQAYQQKYAKAKALFEERCKTAGVVIHRTIKDVEDIELTKVRQPIPFAGKEYFDPMYPEAAMAGEVRGDDYIKQFLMYESRSVQHPEQRGGLGPPTSTNRHQLLPATPGFRFVEVVDETTRKRLRCTPIWTPGQTNWVAGQHRCDEAREAGARYALDFEDLVDPIDRASWVAGTRLKVIDKQTNEVIAELRRFVWDSGFGSNATGRWPWAHASHRATQHCPSAVGIKQYVSRTFVDTVLAPKQGD